jgi:TRAP-type mannitol/chloroaromatic compound transport system permease small subunit
MEKILHAIDAVSEYSGKAISGLVLLLTVVLCYEVIMRYAFNAPTKWAFDMSYMLGGSYFVLGQAYTLQKRKHVRIDLFYMLFTPRTKAALEIFFYLLFFFPLFGLLLYHLIPYVYFSWVMQERSMQGYWMPILYPFKTVMPVGIFLLLLQGLAEFARAIIAFRKGVSP